MVDFRRLIAGLSPLRQEGVKRLGGGPRRWEDIEKNAPDFLDEEEFEEKRQNLGAEPEKTVETVREVSKRYEGYLGPRKAVQPEPVDFDNDVDRAIRDYQEAVEATKAAKGDDAKSAALQKRFAAAPLLQTNLPKPQGLLNDDLTVKGAQKVAVRQEEPSGSGVETSQGSIHAPNPNGPTPPLPGPFSPPPDYEPKGPSPEKKPVRPTRAPAPGSSSPKPSAAGSRSASAASKAGSSTLRGLGRLATKALGPLSAAAAILESTETAQSHGEARRQKPLPGDR